MAVRARSPAVAVGVTEPAARGGRVARGALRKAASIGSNELTSQRAIPGEAAEWVRSGCVGGRSGKQEMQISRAATTACAARSSARSARGLSTCK